MRRLQLTTAGESHGPGLTVILRGLPAGLEVDLDLLRAGGSRSPEELARIVGLDLTDPSIWASGLDALGAELDEAERLADELEL